MLNDNLFRNQKFALGQIVATPGFMEIAVEEEALAILERHATGDWGDICPEDAKLNNESVNGDGRLLSSYTVSNRKVWIITEASRECTTFLFPSEY